MRYFLILLFPYFLNAYYDGECRKDVTTYWTKLYLSQSGGGVGNWYPVQCQTLENRSFHEGSTYYNCGDYVYETYGCTAYGCKSRDYVSYFEKFGASKIECEAGYNLNTEACRCEPQCDQNETYNSETNKCESPKPTCGENELLTADNVCKPFDDLLSDDFPSANDTADTGVRNIPTTEAGCVPGQKAEGALGVIEILGWDYATQTCKTMMYKCKPQLTMDLKTRQCIVPPNNLEIDDDICPGNNWGRRWTHDFCGDCVGTVGVWLPPLGHEESGMQCNHAYVEYNCVSDYRLKKYVEVSCGIPEPTPDNTTVPESSMQDAPANNDINASKLNPIDTTEQTKRIVEELVKVNDTLKSTKDAISADLKKIDDSIKSQNSKLDTQITKLDDIKTNTALTSSNAAAVVTNTAMMNSKLSDIKNSLIGDNPIPEDGFPDGSDKFGEYSNSLISSFNVTEETDLFGLSSSNYNLPTFSFSILGKTFVVFTPNMLTDLPIDEIRALIIFLFALSGFITVIRTV